MPPLKSKKRPFLEGGGRTKKNDNFQKKFTHHKSPTSLIGMEIPSKNGKHYPLPFRSEMKKAEKCSR